MLLTDSTDDDHAITVTMKTAAYCSDGCSGSRCSRSAKYIVSRKARAGAGSSQRGSASGLRPEESPQQQRGSASGLRPEESPQQQRGPRVGTDPRRREQEAAAEKEAEKRVIEALARSMGAEGARLYVQESKQGPTRPRQRNLLGPSPCRPPLYNLHIPSQVEFATAY